MQSRQARELHGMIGIRAVRRERRLFESYAGGPLKTAADNYGSVQQSSNRVALTGLWPLFTNQILKAPSL
jgi:hypothetical protein